MAENQHRVDGFRFMPPKLSAWIKSKIPPDFIGEIPFTPLKRPLSASRVSVVTSAGISMKSDPPFDMEPEKQDPTKGDTSFRKIPKGAREGDIEVNHLHINTDYIYQDMNVIFPLERMEELETENVIGSLAPTAYSFYGFQWENDLFMEMAVAPMIRMMKNEAVEAVLLTPA